MLMLFCQLLMIDPDWLLHGIRGRPKILKPFRQKNQDEIIAKLLGMPAGSLFPFHLTGGRERNLLISVLFHLNMYSKMDFFFLVNLCSSW